MIAFGFPFDAVVRVCACVRLLSVATNQFGISDERCKLLTLEHRDKEAVGILELKCIVRIENWRNEASESSVINRPKEGKSIKIDMNKRTNRNIYWKSQQQQYNERIFRNTIKHSKGLFSWHFFELILHFRPNRAHNVPTPKFEQNT